MIFNKEKLGYALYVADDGSQHWVRMHEYRAMAGGFTFLSDWSSQAGEAPIEHLKLKMRYIEFWFPPSKSVYQLPIAQKENALFTGRLLQFVLDEKLARVIERFGEKRM